MVGLLGGVAISVSLGRTWEPIMGLQRTGINFLYAAWWSFVGSLVLNIIVSKLTKPEPLEKIQGLVYGLVVKDTSTQEMLKNRAEGGE